MYETVAFPAVATPARTPEALDAHLLRGIARRDHDAFARCYDRHAGAVAKAALAICRNASTAEDIVQIAFLALWERAERLYARGVRLRPWLVTVARNAAIDILRTGSAAAAALDDAADRAAGEPDPEAAIVAAETAAAIDGAIAALSPEQQAVIRAIYFDGKTAPQIAAELGAPVNTVKSRLRLALGHLRAHLPAERA